MRASYCAGAGDASIGDRKTSRMTEGRLRLRLPLPSSRTGCTGPAVPGHLGAARTPDAEAPAARREVRRTPLSSWHRSPMAGDRNRASPVSSVLSERPISELIYKIIFAAFGLFISLTDGPSAGSPADSPGRSSSADCRSCPSAVRPGLTTVLRVLSPSLTPAMRSHGRAMVTKPASIRYRWSPWFHVRDSPVGDGASKSLPVETRSSSICGSYLSLGSSGHRDWSLSGIFYLSRRRPPLFPYWCRVSLTSRSVWLTTRAFVLQGRPPNPL